MNNKTFFIVVAVLVAGTVVSFGLRYVRPAANTTESTVRNETNDGELQQIFDAAFRAVNCPTAQRVFPTGAYTGPLIDTHIHIAPIPESLPAEAGERPSMGVNVTIADYVCMADTEGTTQMFAFFPVWEPITKPLLDVVQRTVESFPGRFVPFIMPPDHDDSPNGFPTVTVTELAEMLADRPGLFQGYGEIGLYARDGGAPELPPDSPRLTAIYPTVRDNKLIVYVHLGAGQKDSFERALGQNPDITFIWHGDQLITQREDGGQDLSVVEEILREHPNARYGIDELYGDTWLLRPEVTKEEFLAHFQNPEPLLEKDLRDWKGFIERHPDQVLWGTDRGWSAPWSLDRGVALVLNDYSRTFIGRLDPAVQERFAHKNAEAILQNQSQ